ncbi:MAG: cation transporter [Planctomycetes bacterium GWA2_40_7]|nr:MAG: cation transporter [Planctomycetes bacterium GWA2_40_7]OHB47078.1 MAG: cation transporter [Planctomycetes bacterium GWF2_40_8]OHB90375.1 MAG: cation transporter [Planctomycetes bacterium RIFCSPHIGHO2_02_FULL_40_12]OHC04451.1 MAG: cation transporter [Planctomycetes bacterium RIFCSPLOWO2_12_FULL_40_19]
MSIHHSTKIDKVSNSSHNHTHRGEERSKLILACSLTGAMFIVEGIAGFLTNSLALLSDAGHMLTHLIALLISLGAILFAAKPPTARKTYGFYRLEILAALFNGATLFLITLWIFFHAYKRIINPEPIASWHMLIVAVIGLIVNLACAYILKTSHGSLNIKSAFIHMMADTFSSLVVVFGAIIMHYTQWYMLDPALSILICIVILVWSYQLITESVDILLEATPKDVDLENVVKSISELNEIKGVHDVHIWTITSGMYAMSAHVYIKDLMVSETHRIMANINTLVNERFSIGHTVIQFESDVCGDDLHLKRD